jgi:hypothetical protein
MPNKGNTSPIVSERDIKSKVKPVVPLTAYFKGVQSLPLEQQKEFMSLDEKTRENKLKNRIFTQLFKYDPESSNMVLPEDRAIWDNAGNLTTLERDIAVAKKALSQDLDKLSDLKEAPLSLSDFTPRRITNAIGDVIDVTTSDNFVTALNKISEKENPGNNMAGFLSNLLIKGAAKSRKSFRDESMDFLDSISQKYIPVYQNKYNDQNLKCMAQDTPWLSFYH